MFRVSFSFKTGKYSIHPATPNTPKTQLFPSHASAARWIKSFEGTQA